MAGPDPAPGHGGRACVGVWRRGRVANDARARLRGARCASSLVGEPIHVLHPRAETAGPGLDFRCIRSISSRSTCGSAGSVSEGRSCSRPVYELNCP